MWKLFSVASANVAEKKKSHSLSMSETGTEMKLSVKNPLPGKEVKETETMDIVKDNISNS